MLALLERWWRAAAWTAGAIVLAYGVAVSADLVSDDLLGLALGPVALAPEADDAAGDAGPPSADADFTLPVPTPLEDDRVVAAFAPLVNLSCKRSDFAGPDAANLPAADVYAAAETAFRERALAAPMAPSASEVDALMTQHLFAAALSPVLALHAPQEEPTHVSVAVTGAPAEAGACPALLQHTFNRLQTGEPQSLCQFQGKVLVIVNTASHCGNTPQYEGLEAMYRKYKDRGLVVVGFPSNDFGGQEPGTNKEIAEFCRTTYGVQFPMFEKSAVTKSNANPLFIDLIAKTGNAPRWNFHKYVVDRTGTRVVSFADSVKPDARNLVELVERLLAEKEPTAKI
jgi:glutathione peroxidase